MRGTEGSLEVPNGRIRRARALGASLVDDLEETGRDVVHQPVHEDSGWEQGLGTDALDVVLQAGERVADAEPLEIGVVEEALRSRSGPARCVELTTSQVHY